MKLCEELKCAYYNHGLGTKDCFSDPYKQIERVLNEASLR